MQIFTPSTSYPLSCEQFVTQGISVSNVYRTYIFKFNFGQNIQLV